MIQVQIASQVTGQGVSGVRWVLLEPVDAAPLDLPPAADALAAVPAQAADAPAPMAGDSLQLMALKAVVVCLGLGAALATAYLQLGPPMRARALPAAAAPDLAPITAPAPAPAPAPAASGAWRHLTANLR